jgi:hypothetical protein
MMKLLLNFCFKADSGKILVISQNISFHSQPPSIATDKLSVSFRTFEHQTAQYSWTTLITNLCISFFFISKYSTNFMAYMFTFKPKTVSARGFGVTYNSTLNGTVYTCAHDVLCKTCDCVRSELCLSSRIFVP